MPDLSRQLVQICSAGDSFARRLGNTPHPSCLWVRQNPLSTEGVGHPRTPMVIRSGQKWPIRGSRPQLLCIHDRCCHRGSCCRFALYPHVCHAADSFRRRASWYSSPYCVPTVTATRSSKAVGPKWVNNALSVRTPPVLVIAFSVISFTKGGPLRSKSRSWT